jgi:signal peptidase II
MKNKRYILLVVILILLDQGTKALVINKLELSETLVVNSLFNLTHVHNYGAAFSIFSDSSGLWVYFLPLVSVIASIVITVWMLRVDSKNIMKITSLSLLLSGAVGNLVDRLYLGFVEDFISLHYQGYYFPIFNVADTLLSFGIILLIISDTKLNKNTSQANTL